MNHSLLFKDRKLVFLLYSDEIDFAKQVQGLFMDFTRSFSMATVGEAEKDWTETDVHPSSEMSSGRPVWSDPMVPGIPSHDPSLRPPGPGTTTAGNTSPSEENLNCPCVSCTQNTRKIRSQKSYRELNHLMSPS
jgi:hypothetical protein